MNESQISVRYAKALFQSAVELDQLDRVYSDMGLLAETCKLDDFRFLLMQPSLQPSQKSRVAEAVLKTSLSKLSLSMVTLIIQNKRETYLPGIARYFGELYRKARGIKTAKLVTAQPVEDPVREQIKSLIRKAYRSEVELSSMVEEELIGGFILTVEDQQYDASVASKLKKMKKELLQTRIERK